MGLAGYAWNAYQSRKAREAAEERRAQLLALHGIDVGPPASTPSWQYQLAVAAAGLGWRHRVLLAPFAGLVALWLSGAAMTTPGGAAGVWLLWTLWAAVWWPVRWRRLARRQNRQYAAAVWAGSLAWLFAAQHAGVGAVAPLLVVWVGVAGGPWWWRHRPRPRPVDPPAVVDDSLAARWDSGVGAQGKVAPGSYLTDADVTEHFTQYRLVCVPGAASQTVGELNARLHRVASGLQEPQEQLLIERHPFIKDPSQLLVKYLHESPADEVEYLHVPKYDVDRGAVLLGQHTDKDGEGSLRVYAPDGMFGGALIGASGIGKSRLVDTFAVTMRDAWRRYGIPTAIVYLDGQDGASSPALFRHATISAGLDEVDDVLDCLDAAARARQAWNRYYGLQGFTPGYCPPGAEEGLTGLLVICDEGHRVAQGRGKRLAHIAQERRKIGEALFFSDQLSELKAFGNEEGLRSSLFNGNAVVMHVASKSQGNLVPNLDIHPSQLPAIPGYAVKVSKPGGEERTAPFRARYMPSAKDRAEGKAPADVPTVEEWFEMTEDAPLDAMTAKAFEPLFAKRAAREAARVERDRRLMAGEPLELEEAKPDARRPRETATAGRQGGTVLELLSGLRGGGPARRTVGETARTVQLAEEAERPARERIPELLAEHGPLTRQELATKLGVSPSAVTQALRRTDGVTQVPGGRWDVQRTGQTVA